MNHDKFWQAAADWSDQYNLSFKASGELSHLIELEFKRYDDEIRLAEEEINNYQLDK